MFFLWWNPIGTKTSYSSTNHVCPLKTWFEPSKALKYETNLLQNREQVWTVSAGEEDQQGGEQAGRGAFPDSIPQFRFHNSFSFWVQCRGSDFIPDMQLFILNVQYLTLNCQFQFPCHNSDFIPNTITISKVAQSLTSNKATAEQRLEEQKGRFR